MPDILTHLVCAHQSTLTINNKVKEIIYQNKKIFNLGAQGPDFFFYYKIAPWLDSKDIPKFADYIHSKHTKQFFVNAVSLLKNDIKEDFFESTNLDSIAHKKFSYICGFLSHHALDSIAHPYVFYHSGIDSSHNHKYLECIIDTLIRQKYDTKKMKLASPGKAIHIKGYDKRIISEYLSDIISLTYEEIIDPPIIAKAINEIQLINRAVYNPYKYKRYGFEKLDKGLKLGGKLATAIFPAKIDPKIDYLNYTHKEWVHPCDDSIKYTSSFMDLLNESIKETSLSIYNLEMYLKGITTRDEYTITIKNVLYDTGLDPEKSQKMIHDNSILDFKVIFKI